MIIESLIKGSVIPGVIMGAFALAGGLLNQTLTKFVLAVAAPLAFTVGFYFLTNWPVLPPLGGKEALWAFMLANIVYVIGFHILPKASWILRALLSLIGASLLFVPAIENFWSFWETGFHYLGFLAAHLIYWNFQDKTDKQDQGRWGLLFSVLLGTGLSLMLLFSGSALLSQLTGTFCAVVSAQLAITLLRPTLGNSSATEAFRSSALVGFGFLAYYLLELSIWPLFLLFASVFLAAWMGKIPGKSILIRLALKSLAVTPLIAIAVYWVFSTQGAPY